MAKQVKVEGKKTSGKAAGTPVKLKTRSPRTNLIFAGLLGLVYLALFDQNVIGALIYAGAAFMFFCTVDYCVLYYRTNKKERN